MQDLADQACIKSLPRFLWLLAILKCYLKKNVENRAMASFAGATSISTLLKFLNTTSSFYQMFQCRANKPLSYVCYTKDD